MVLIDLVYIKDRNYNPQVFLKKYKHVVRKKTGHILLLTTEIYSDYSGDSDEKTQMKKLVFKRNKNNMINLLF